MVARMRRREQSCWAKPMSASGNPVRAHLQPLQPRLQHHGEQQWRSSVDCCWRVTAGPAVGTLAADPPASRCLRDCRTKTHHRPYSLDGSFSFHRCDERSPHLDWPYGPSCGRFSTGAADPLWNGLEGCECDPDASCGLACRRCTDISGSHLHPSCRSEAPLPTRLKRAARPLKFWQTRARCRRSPTAARSRRPGRSHCRLEAADICSRRMVEETRNRSAVEKGSNSTCLRGTDFGGR